MFLGLNSLGITISASDSPTAGMATNAAPPAAKPAPAQVRPTGWGPVDRVTVEIFALKKTIGKP